MGARWQYVAMRRIDTGKIGGGGVEMSEWKINYIPSL